MREIHTKLVQHLVALIDDEALHGGEAEHPLANKGVETARSSHDDVWVRLLVAESVDILLHVHTTIEDARLHVRNVLAEASVLVSNLERKLARVGDDQTLAFALDGLDLLERRKHEDCGLAESGLGLAEDVRAEDGLRDDHLLDCIASRC